MYLIEKAVKNIKEKSKLTEEYKEKNDNLWKVKYQFADDIKRYKDYQTEQSGVTTIEQEILEREKRVKLMRKIIQQRTENYREVHQHEMKHEFAKCEKEIELCSKKIKDTNICVEFNLGELVDKINATTNKHYKAKIIKIEGASIHYVGSKIIETALNSWLEEEDVIRFIVKIGPYLFNAQANLKDELKNGKKIFEVLKQKDYSLFKKHVEFDKKEINNLNINLTNEDVLFIDEKLNSESKNILINSISKVDLKQEEKII